MAIGNFQVTATYKYLRGQFAIEETRAFSKRLENVTREAANNYEASLRLTDYQLFENDLKDQRLVSYTVAELKNPTKSS